MKKSLIALMLVIILCFFVGCSKTAEDKLITSFNSPVKGYTVSFYQVGEPQGTFGDVTAKLVFEDSEGNIIKEEVFEVTNDGANLDDSNIISFTWDTDWAEVVIVGRDTTNEITYKFDYK